MGGTSRGSGSGRAPKLDNGTADRLLSGSLAPADAPPGYELVAGMVNSARPSTARGPIPGEAQVLAAYRVALAGTPIPLAVARQEKVRKERSLLMGRLPVKVAAAAALVLVGGTAAAAATGALPGPLQSTVSSALKHVGISVPAPSGPVVNPHPSSNASPHAFAGSDNSLFGQCTAYTSHGTASHAPLPARLSNAASSAGETVTQFCNSIPNPSNANPASSPSAHTSDEAGTVQGNSTGSGGPAGPGGAGTHNGTPGPPADQGNTNSAQGQGTGQGEGTGQGKGKGAGQATATTTTTTSTTTTTTTVKSGGGGHTSNLTSSQGTGKH